MNSWGERIKILAFGGSGSCEVGRDRRERIMIEVMEGWRRAWARTSEPLFVVVLISETLV